MKNIIFIPTRPGLTAGVLAVCVLALATGSGAQQAPATVTLDEAIERALEHSPQIAQSRQQVLNAEESQRLAWGAFLPTVSGSAGSSLRSTDRFDPGTDRIVSGSSDAYNAGVNARYTLFAGGQRFADMDAAKADVGAAEARMIDQRYGVVLATKTVFFQALRQEELADVAASRVAQAEESLRMTRERAQVGSATSSDTLRARLEMVNARQAALQADAALRNARVGLGRQIGVAGPVEPAAPADELEPAPLALEETEILALAEAESPAVRAAAGSALAARADMAAARTQYLPSVSLSSGYNWANQAASFGGGATSWNLGLSLSYPIFNGFQREAQVARARAAFDVADRQELDARLVARSEADAALQTIRTQASAIEIAEEAVQVAEEDLRVVRERYTASVARVYDVIVSQVALDQARVDLVQARYDYLLALAELEAILGREL